MGSGAEHRDVAFAKKETADLGVRAAVFLMLLTSLLFVCKLSGAGLLHFVNDSLESGGVVDSEVSDAMTSTAVGIPRGAEASFPFPCAGAGN